MLPWELFVGVRNSAGDEVAHWAHLGGALVGFYWYCIGIKLIAENFISNFIVLKVLKKYGMSVLEQVKNRKVFFGADNDILIRIVIINVLITTVLFFIRSVYQVSGLETALYKTQVADWFILPADTARFVTRPWTIISFMFSHADIWGLVANMLWLWGFGFIVQSLLGDNKLVPLYIYGGLAGAIVYLLSSNLVSAFAATATTMTLSGAIVQ